MQIERQTFSLQSEIARQSFIPAFKEAMTKAFTLDAIYPPKIPDFWSDKTKQIVGYKWNDLPILSKRIIMLCTDLANNYPQCSTLEGLTKFASREKDLVPERIIRFFQKVQDKARNTGNTQLTTGSAMVAAMLPLMDLVPHHEQSEVGIIIKLLPPLIFASVGTHFSSNRPNSRAKRILREAGHEVTRSALRLRESGLPTTAKKDLKTAGEIFSTTRQKRWTTGQKRIVNSSKRDRQKSNH